MNFNNIDYIEKNAPATQDEIESVEKHINRTIPRVYKEFFKICQWDCDESMCTL